MQRSIWIKDMDWIDIKYRAKLFGVSVSQYLLKLHKAKVRHKEDGVIRIGTEPSTLGQDQINHAEFFKPRPKGKDGIREGKK